MADDTVSSILADTPPSPVFAAEEDKVLAFWEESGAFKKQLELSKGKPEYTFYDGPPFATGLPHYGHILAGTIKDTVTRYASQTGHFVQRRAGWDCHGLPVEFEIDKMLGIKTREQVLEMGIANYNKECRGIVMRYTTEWETTVKRLGRWIDFEDDYKTMDPTFMESVWWVFKQLHDKGLVYQGHKVMPYSMACGTPLSNFEANLNYQDVNDPAVVVAFPVIGPSKFEGASLLAWTTTPWTLPSNLALCVNADFVYVKIEDLKGLVATPDAAHGTGSKVFIILEALLPTLYPEMSGKKWKKKDNDKIFKVLERDIKGTDLVGTKYVPLFDYFAKDYGESAFRVISDGYVTADSGTGIVHQAPAFGEDDSRVCIANGIYDPRNSKVKLPCPLDFNGNYTSDVPDFQGRNCKEADEDIIKLLKSRGRLVKKSSYSHNYPFCWRSDTPLIYKAVPSWFVAVESIKDKLLKNNADTYWVPNFVKEGRFHNWLADARDWAISRNRFWGTPIPMWVSEDMEEMVAIGSVEELETLAGLPKGSVKDLHRESIDDIEIPSKQGKGKLRRVDEVFDCWFESGSMPYAQLHYPFENKDRFEKGFPAHFIAEGLDQTRGWFYTLMVLSTALFDKPAFTNLIVNGMVLAADGKKMSKRLKNYPPPDEVVNSYGADALRMYLINSPVVRAEPLKFREDGVYGVAKDVMIPWYNAFRFMVQNASRWEGTTGRSFRPSSDLAKASKDEVDVWILADIQNLVAFVHQEMEAYRLYTVMPRLVAFLETFTKWYLRLNRDRIKGADGDAEAEVALSVTYDVLLSATSIMSPFTPFFSEFLYQKLRKLHPNYIKAGGAQSMSEDMGSAESVHFLMLPRPDPNADAALNARVAQEMEALQIVVELGRKAREAKDLSLKKPVVDIVVVVSTEVQRAGLAKLQKYICSELTALKITVTTNEDEWCEFSAIPNFKALGQKCGKEMQKVKAAITSLDKETLATFRREGQMEVLGFALTTDDIVVTRQFAGDAAKYSALESDDGSMVVAVECTETEQTVKQWLAREFVSCVQKLRKSGGVELGEPVEVFYSEEVSVEANAFGLSYAKAFADAAINDSVVSKIGGNMMPLSAAPVWPNKPLGCTVSKFVPCSVLTISIARPGLAVSAAAIAKSYPDVDPEVCKTLVYHVAQACPPSITLVLDGSKLELAKGTHYFEKAADMIAK